MNTLFKCLYRRLPKPFHSLNSQAALPGGGTLLPKISGFKLRVFKTVKQKIHQIRHHGLCALSFQKLHNMIVGGG